MNENTLLSVTGAIITYLNISTIIIDYDNTDSPDESYYCCVCGFVECNCLRSPLRLLRVESPLPLTPSESLVSAGVFSACGKGVKLKS